MHVARIVIRRVFNSRGFPLDTIFFATLFLLGCFSQRNPKGSYARPNNTQNFSEVKPHPIATKKHACRIAFYNVENLFDTIDGENDDAEFHPNSDLHWNSERYLNKLRNIAKVIDSIHPDILGIVEVENISAMKDLQKHSSWINQFAIAHRDSPDKRGIDVALFYNPSKFSVSGIYMIPISLPDGYATRSIMRVHLVSLNGRDSMVVFVNHWPSRRSGEASVANRVIAASILHKNIVSTQNFSRNCIVMGDFNDNPSDSSIAKVLLAGNADAPLVNLALLAKLLGVKGSHAWFDGWNFFDQIMVSNAIFAYSAKHNKRPALNIYSRDWMLEKGGKYDSWPLRTYGNKKLYRNGFSDHLPVYVDLFFERN